MLLFRSEEHIERWCQQWNQPRGEVISLQQQWRLAQSWYADRMQFDWRRKTTEEIKTLWTELGFTSPFWDLNS
jgi:Alkylmercury lyase